MDFHLRKLNEKEYYHVILLGIKKKLDRVDHQLLLTYYHPTIQWNDSIMFHIYRKIQAFIYDATPLEYHAGNDNNCELKTVGEKYAMTGYGVAVPQKASYLEEINEVILELKENGNYCFASSYVIQAEYM